MNGACAITYVQIQAWASLTGRSPDPVEVRALIALDHAWRSPDAKGS